MISKTEYVKKLWTIEFLNRKDLVVIYFTEDIEEICEFLMQNYDQQLKSDDELCTLLG